MVKNSYTYKKKEKPKAKATHKMPDGTVMSGKTHSKDSKPISKPKSGDKAKFRLKVDKDLERTLRKSGRAEEVYRKSKAELESKLKKQSKTFLVEEALKLGLPKSLKRENKDWIIMKLMDTKKYRPKMADEYFKSQVELDELNQKIRDRKN